MATVEKLTPFYELLLRGDKTGKVVGGHVQFWDILKIDGVVEREGTGAAVPIAELMKNPAYDGAKVALADVLSEAFLAQQAALDEKLAECEKHDQAIAALKVEHQEQLAALSEQVSAANAKASDLQARVIELLEERDALMGKVAELTAALPGEPVVVPVEE